MRDGRAASMGDVRMDRRASLTDGKDQELFVQALKELLKAHRSSGGRNYSYNDSKVCLHCSPTVVSFWLRVPLCLLTYNACPSVLADLQRQPLCTY